jgi:hypothetical protein
MEKELETLAKNMKALNKALDTMFESVIEKSTDKEINGKIKDLSTQIKKALNSELSLSELEELKKKATNGGIF